MTYTTETNLDCKVLIARISGEVNNDDSKRIGLELRTKAIKKGLKLMLDTSKADLSYVKVLDIELMFKEFYDKIDLRFRELPTAIIINKNFEQLSKFVNLSWTKSGINTSVKQTEQSALKWLCNY